MAEDEFSSKLAKTKMAKPVSDQGWSDSKGMLSNKAIGRYGIFLQVNEAFSAIGAKLVAVCIFRIPPTR